MEKNGQKTIDALNALRAAKWIDPELPHEKTQRQPASVLRRRFTWNGSGNAELLITCHGLYEAVLNGQRVGDFVLSPGTGDYRQRLFVQQYDVSGLLKAGENELVVTLGDGWYRGSVGIDGLTNYYGEDLALLCALLIDGQAVLKSDEGWEASQEGPTRENDLQQGESYDARKEEITSWHPVTVRDFGYENLVLDEGVPILMQERFDGKLLKTPNGETVIDFGQNLAGFTELRLTAKAGQKIALWHGETLDENGNFTQKNFDPGDRNKAGIPQKLEYICKDGLNCWHPRFTIFGFRYVKIETDADLSEAHFSSIAVYSKLPQTGFFTCGNEHVNRLFLNSLWSMRSNFVDIPTDCPTRERAGWTGDAQVFAPAAVLLADCYPVLRKWLGECRLAQKEDGLVQNISPVNNAGSMISNMLQGSAGWGDACVIVPWVLYQAYGRKEILEENYEMMRKWLVFTGKRARKTRISNLRNPYRRYLVDQGFHFGEWCQPDVNNMAAMKTAMMHGMPEVATAYYYRSASLMAKIAKILGKEKDAEKYEAVAEGARNAYRFTCTKDGKILSERQCEYVRPVAFGLLDGNEAQAAADDLNALVVKNGYHLNTGFLSTPDLLRVLSDHGHTDTAYCLLLQEEKPSWLYAVKKGATTIWETWDGVREDGTVHDSLNHYSYGAVSGWLIDGVCGIIYRDGTLRFEPHPDRSLGFAKAAWNSPGGRIESAWRYEGGQVRYDFTVPAGLTAEVTLPDGRKCTLKEGTHTI
ncbi:MAG: family 78 glycoside hydrolase catalytic domain [Lachnospiraceae bacterium]|nr:family 78 glycoside hydrolase catalytic domain [Lachnospiraceae bacterium]